MRKKIQKEVQIKERKIPATMVTQHPDNAGKPYWHTKAYIATQYEAEEAFLSFSQLGATEYMWDWEGKLVDESLVERFLGQHYDYFSQHPLGTDLFLTFRLPNPRVQTEFRLLRAFINMASAASVARHFGFTVPPLFEVILPLTESAEEMLALQEAYEEIHHLKHNLYRLDGFLTNVRIIPTFENITTILQSDKILMKYLRLYKKRFHKRPPYMRPFLARSDPTLNSGIIPTVLAIKIALSRYKKLAKKLAIPLYPIIGAAALPFRGGLTPETVKEFIVEYPGIRTTTIQSAFRYDFSIEKVKKAIVILENELPRHEAQEVSVVDEKRLLKIISKSETIYKQTVEQIAPFINTLSTSIPQRRERFLHVGLFGYSRGEGKVRLPRAIGFTACLYSLGIPPELIATGRTLAYVREHHLLFLLEKYYKNLRKNLLRSGAFLNKQNLQALQKASPVWWKITEDVLEIETYLGQELGPKTQEEKRHKLVTTLILKHIRNKKKLPVLIQQAGILRKSLG